MDVFESMSQSLLRFSDNRAFCIDGLYYSYRDLTGRVSAIRMLLNKTAPSAVKGVALAFNDDLETYAAILAIWFEGRYYVPLNMQVSAERNEKMIVAAGIKIMLESSDTALFPDLVHIKINEASPVEINLNPNVIHGNELAYTLFTSGSTGIPKGVPITRHNLSAFTEAFLQMNLNTNENDRWLQMFDLTFDLSIFSFLIPLLQGACVYTIPKNQIKYNYIVKLLDEEQLTVALMIPSVIHFLRPYFDEIENLSLRYNLFCGESLTVELIKKWSNCIPKAEIFNVYGPTEATIFCTSYPFKRQLASKSKNGILSLGKPFQSTQVVIVNEKNQIVTNGDVGELCLSGSQITPGYLNNIEANHVSFIELNIDQRPISFYKTGDLCSINMDGDILFSGRLDAQIKVSGFRVELAEIECCGRTFTSDLNVVALAIVSEQQKTEIGLVIEGRPFPLKPFVNYLKEKLPYYMIPFKIIFEEVLPLNSNGKIDRKYLEKRFLQQ